MYNTVKKYIIMILEGYANEEQREQATIKLKKL